MTAQTKTGEYLRSMAQQGHSSQKLGEASLALTECYLKSDTHAQSSMGNRLATQMEHILSVVYGWSAEDARDAEESLRDAFSDTATDKEASS